MPWTDVQTLALVGMQTPCWCSHRQQPMEGDAYCNFPWAWNHHVQAFHQWISWGDETHCRGNITSVSAPELQHKRGQVINYLKHNDTLGMRGDYKYKELIELCIYYVEGVCDEVYDKASKRLVPFTVLAGWVRLFTVLKLIYYWQPFECWCCLHCRSTAGG